MGLGLLHVRSHVSNSKGLTPALRARCTKSHVLEHVRDEGVDLRLPRSQDRFDGPKELFDVERFLDEGCDA